MPSLPLPQLIGHARSQWLNGDPQAWARYVACCLELDAKLRAVPNAQPPVLHTQHELSAPLNQRPA